MKITVIGKGRVGRVLGPSFKLAGHEVVYGVRDPSDEKYQNDDGIPLLTTNEAAQSSDVVILSVDWSTALVALEQCGDLEGKVLIDCNNPLVFTENGLELTLGFSDSAAEQIDARTNAKVVKALNQVGSPVMARARDFEQRPIQFVASDHDDAKELVSKLLVDIGFSPVDYGPLINARKLEPLAMIWIDQAFKHDMNPETAWFMNAV